MELDATSAEWFYKKMAFNLNLFFSRQSSPSNLVGKMAAMSFNSCCKLPITLLASSGKLVPLSDLRLEPPAEMAAFVKTTPLVPRQFSDMCPDVIRSFEHTNLLVPVSLDDVLAEFNTRGLPAAELVAFMKWWVGRVAQGKISQRDVERLRSCLVYVSPDSPVALKNITHFSTQKVAPKFLPVPDTCLDLEVSKFFSASELQSCFWGWKELKGIEWTLFIAKHKRFQQDPEFTESCMAAISRCYVSLSQREKALVVSTLASLRCVNTESGLKTPQECYFPNVSLFHDLPKLANPKSLPESFLKELGVREHVDLQLIFDRLGELSWDQTQLIKYLGSIQEKLAPHELSSLTNTPLFVRENGSQSQRFLASQLYPPIDKFRAFPNLNLLSWTGKWKYVSQEATLMARLGLNKMVSLAVLIDMIANSPSLALKIPLFKYFASEPDYEKVYKPAAIETPFIPLTSGSLGLPCRCFSDADAALLGFDIIDPTIKPFAAKLGVAESPSVDALIKQLVLHPPTTPDSATKIFSYLASKKHLFQESQWQTLKHSRFIPVETARRVQHHTPSSVYIKGDQLLSQFTYVSFGSVADQFLRLCGVQLHPSPIELAYAMARTPDLFLSSYESYLELLLQVAANYRQLRSDSTLFRLMQSSTFLVGVKHSAAEGSQNDVKIYCLAKAQELYLVDDPVLARVFKPTSAPIEELLEFMYQDLGSLWLSSCVKETYSASGSVAATAESHELQDTIQKRAPLLLYDGHTTRKPAEIAANALSCLEKMQVREIAKIEIVREFSGEIKSEETTSCLRVENGQTIVLVTKKFDFFDVASVLAKVILKRPRLNDSLLISTFLSTSLGNLSRKGFPVERILKKSTIAAPVERIAAPPIAKHPEAKVRSLDPPPKAVSPQDDFFGSVFKKLGDSLGISAPLEKNQPESTLPGHWKPP
ncbi:hypothetical protein HDU91_005682, partial [Kappamyces sp. JEL0680]